MTHNRFVVVPAAYVIFLRDSPADASGQRRREVLLQLRQGTGYMDGHWASAAAGHVERGESVYAAAAREALEELGISGVQLTPVCAMQRTAQDETGHAEPIDERVDYFFTSSRWAGEPRIVEPEKCADLRWFGLDELPDPVVPHELAVLEAIRADDVPPVMVHGF
ncbi:MAG: NUDIX domain-containing protein [Nocardioides sp.]